MSGVLLHFELFSWQFSVVSCQWAVKPVQPAVLKLPTANCKLPTLDRFDLPVIQFHWCRTTENADHDRDLSVGFVELFDIAF